MSKHTMEELRKLQSLPLGVKIEMTKGRIKGWIDEYDAYVSFSGGKDSTVLLHMCREVDQSIPAVYIDAGLEYPELREFVKTFDNVTWLKPKMNFRKIIEHYGYPIISKEVSECVYDARVYLQKCIEKEQSPLPVDKSLPYWYRFEKLIGAGEYINTKKKRLENILGEENVPDILKGINDQETAIDNYRVQKLLGILRPDGKATIDTIPVKSEDKSKYSCKKWCHLLDADFKISNRCCYVMKKAPGRKYRRETGRKPITGQLASESMLRTQKWLQNGCNGFDMKNPTSNPMAFWTDQDVLAYIKVFNIPICSIYGDIVREDGVEITSTDGWLEADVLDNARPLLKTTGVARSGCIFCGFGAQFEDEPNRFQKLKTSHPQLWQYCMKPWQDGGLGMKHVLDFINVKTE